MGERNNEYTVYRDTNNKVKDRRMVYTAGSRGDHRPVSHTGGHRRILCPFDKAESEYVKVLTEYGFDVTYSHIETGTDFFEIDNLNEYDAIVSNPPFSKRDAVFERLFESGVPFAMLMNMVGLFDSRRRWEMFNGNEFELIVPKGRVHFFTEESKGRSPAFVSIYICHGMAERQIEFVEIPSRQIRMEL